ncbi:MAG: DUF885 family protein [Gemmatimonadota bacterium]
MKTNLISIAVLAAAALTITSGCRPESGNPEAGTPYEELVESYLRAWTEFHPTEAVGLGLHEHLALTEDRGAGGLEEWIALNEEVLDSISARPGGLSVDLRIDLRLLESRVRSELRTWRDEAPLRQSPAVYAEAIRNLLNIPHQPRGFTAEELDAVAADRLEAVGKVTRDLRSQLETGDRQEIAQAVQSLDRAREGLGELVQRFPGVDSLASGVAGELAVAAAFLREEVEVRDAAGDTILGRDRYARELELYYGMEITPEEVAERALAEMKAVRQIIMDVSAKYWDETYPHEPPPSDVGELVSRVSADMEENRPSSQQESLAAFTRFAREAEAFVAEKGIASLPRDRTLEIILTPESAGPLQRIGFVDSPPPFDPDPVTILSLPTIPDTFPAREKEDFYRSFNNHFNKFIIIHELFPGHYMQLKIASQNPRRIRSFFPYEPYIEGWATLVETFALEAGWDDFNKLTYLAHLRKRLENANRAYTSVQVHCFGWDEEQVREFSEAEALLAPQFAESLWGRLLRGPMQMTSYFMGKEMFVDVLGGEKDRLGEDFDLKTFSDVILKAGAVPLDLIPPLLAESRLGTL